MFPANYNYYRGNLNINNSGYCKWIDSKTLKITKIGEEPIIISKSSKAQYTESITLNYINFAIKVSNKPDNVSLKFERTFTNVTDYPGNPEKNYNTFVELNNGINEIPAFNEKMFLLDRNEISELYEFKLTATGPISVANIYIELVPIDTGGWNKVNGSTGYSNLVNVIIPEVVDKLNEITKTQWNCAPANLEFWDNIKEWYNNNFTRADMVQRGLFANSNIDEVRLCFNEWIDVENTQVQIFLYANRPFDGSTIKKIILKSENGCSFSSANSFFYNTPSLEQIEFIPNADIDSPKVAKRWLFGATDMSGMFEFSNVETYPPNLINWSAHRSNAFDNGIPCTLSGYVFDYANIVTIPVYNNGERFTDANTWVFTKFADQTFNGAKHLTTIGPVLDLILVSPFSGSNNIFNCPNLVDVRIKNLNHGVWNFTNNRINGVYHGYLPNLNLESITYLFDNLVDLKTHNPLVHENKIDKAFLSWNTNYANAWSTEFWMSRVSTRYFETRKRYESVIGSEFIVSTNGTFENMGIEVSGLREGDSIIFGDGSVDNTTIISTNGKHYISKLTNNVGGFTLIGDPTNGYTVKVVIENGLDYTNPNVNTGGILCPKEWKDKINGDMISNAEEKGWHILFDDENEYINLINE